MCMYLRNEECRIVMWLLPVNTQPEEVGTGCNIA